MGISVKGSGSEAMPYLHRRSPTTYSVLSTAPSRTRTEHAGRGVPPNVNALPVTSTSPRGLGIARSRAVSLPSSSAANFHIAASEIRAPSSKEKNARAETTRWASARSSKILVRSASRCGLTVFTARW